MTGLRASTRCTMPGRRGLTLIEMAISIILVSVMLAVALKTVGASKVSQRTLFDRRIGDQLAQGLMAEILQQDYADGVFGPDSFGLNPQEATAGDRSLFDDVDDYDGWTASPPQHKDGTVMMGRTGWRRTVVVHWVSPTDVSTVVGGNQGVKRIVVIVSRDTVPVAQLQAIRTSGLPDAEACCFTDDTCLVTDADTCLALGGWPQGEHSDCYSSTCCTPAVVYEGLSKAAPPVPATEVMLDTPTGTGKDDLLIAVIVVNQWVSISSPLLGGWTKVAEQSHPVQPLTVGVWWKNAAFLEPGPHIFTWTAPGACYAWMARFTGHSMTNTIDSVATGTGNSTLPPCPAVITSYDNCMILRIGGFDGEMITADDPGLAGHAAITMGDSPGEGGCSGGAGYLMQPTAGDSGVAAFTLTGDEEYVTLTIAVPAAECQ